MSRCFHLELTAFAGTDIDQACDEAIRIADLLGITILFGFNGVECMATPGCDPAGLAASWHRVMSQPGLGKFASAPPRLEPQ
jgi:hypothetical protein